ncbi:MAG: Hsp70 family protein, partial [Bdellovibrionota bacterium]
MSKSSLIYAIDFGTSNSLLGAADVKKIHPLAPLDPSAPEPEVLRSLMYFEPRSPALFGLDAVRRYTNNSMNGRFLRSFKRFLPMKSFENTLIDSKLWSLEELIGRFLREMRERANAHYGNDVNAVVMGRP